MDDQILITTYNICKVIASAKYPEELELLDTIWPAARRVLARLIEVDLATWPLTKRGDEVFLGLGFDSPETMKLAIGYIMLVTPPILSNLLKLGISNPEDIKKRVSNDLKIYGDIFSVPKPLLKHLEKALPELLEQIPEELAETRTCWKILPGGEKEEITIKESRDLSKDPNYAVIINMLHDPPLLYVAGERLDVRKKAVKVLAALLMKDGETCRYEEISEQGLGEIYDEDPDKEYDSIIERTINQALRKRSPLLEKCIKNEEKKGYKIQGKLLNYCIIRRKDAF